MTQEGFSRKLTAIMSADLSSERKMEFRIGVNALFLQLLNCRLLMDYTTGISRMVPKTGELHRHAFVNELSAENGSHSYLQKRPELGSRASFTLRDRSPPQHCALGNVPDICRTCFAFPKPFIDNELPLKITPLNYYIVLLPIILLTIFIAFC